MNLIKLTRKLQNSAEILLRPDQIIGIDDMSEYGCRVYVKDFPFRFMEVEETFGEIQELIRGAQCL